MKKIAITLAVTAISAGLLGAVVWASRQTNPPMEVKNNEAEITANETESKKLEANMSDDQSLVSADVDHLYWGKTCPYCHDVIDWMDENLVEDQLDIVRKEVYENQENSAELSQRSQSCGMGERAGVPFMYTDEGECIVGSTPIIDYLQQKLDELPNLEESAASNAEPNTQTSCCD